MKVISVNNKKVIIRKSNKFDAKALIEYLNVIGGESDFLTFGIGQFDRSVEEKEDFIEDALRKKMSYLL